MISDETLMAYADGELDASERAQVEAAIAADPQMARRVEQHKALRRQLNATFDRVLAETVPDRLVKAALSAPREATVTDLRRVRAARAAEAKEAAASARRTETPDRRWTWFEWGAMAASLVIGALVTFIALDPSRERIGLHEGTLVAQADLAQALSNQLASTQSPGAPVQIGVSFRSQEGSYCRTFVIRPDGLGGLACRREGAWQVQTLAEIEGGRGGETDYRPASASMPRAVLAAVEQKIAGEALDASGETTARSHGWQ